MAGGYYPGQSNFKSFNVMPPVLPQSKGCNCHYLLRVLEKWNMNILHRPDWTFLTYIVLKSIILFSPIHDNRFNKNLLGLALVLMIASLFSKTGSLHDMTTYFPQGEWLREANQKWQHLSWHSLRNQTPSCLPEASHQDQSTSPRRRIGL